MNQESDVERIRAAFSDSGRALPRRDCPEPEQIWEARQGELSEAARLSVIDHVSNCEACTEAWGLAGELNQALQSKDSKVVRGSFPWFSNRSLLAAAASLVLLVSAVFVARLLDQPGFREAPGEGIESQLPENRVLSRDQCLLKWTPGPDGSLYHLRVTTEDLELIAAARELREPQYLVSMESLVQVPVGGRILWQVEARTPGGETLMSTTFVNRVD